MQTVPLVTGGRPCSRPSCVCPLAVRKSLRSSSPFQRHLLNFRKSVSLQSSRHASSRGGTCSASSQSNGAQEYVEQREFRIEQISFGSILTPIGVGLLVYGFGAFFQLLPGSDVSSLLLIYGFPVSLLGFALSYAQLKPVPCKSTQQALNLRESQMTDIQKQVREDVTRFRYGDEQHLDEALGRIFMFGRQQGIPRRLTPELKGVREEVREGRYTLVLEFAIKRDMTLEMWTDRQSKIQTFFGPGIKAEIDSPQKGKVDVYLISDGSGLGRTGVEQKDVLPPLVPGAKARSQQ